MPNTTATVNGPLHAVPCAHCGSPQDLREADKDMLCEVGRGVICDACNRTSEIVGVREIKIVVLRQL